jgi:cation:H+ antiporter
MLVAAVTLVGLVGSWFWSRTSPNTVIDLTFTLFQIVGVSIVIWQACDPFADAAQWFGERWRLPSSVRGATLDAIASSMPELFSGLFFVIVAIRASNGSSDQVAVAGTEGLGATIATCAGSAVYNMMLIPALCGIVIAATRKKRPVIEIDSSVITRDGLWFLVCELVLITFLFQPAMHWMMGVALLALYALYISQLFLDSRRFQRARDTVASQFTDGVVPPTDDLITAISDAGIRPSLHLIAQVRRELAAASDEDNGPHHELNAGILFNLFQIKLNPLTGYTILGGSTIVAAAACYWLVCVTHELAEALNVPLFFVAVIVAAAASSVPDTFLSIAAAQRGDDDGAVSNAFGSNVFDICVCLSIPLLVNCYLNGWQPIALSQNGEPLEGLFGLQVLLVTFTIITLLIMWRNLRLTAAKSWILVGLYGIFIAYAVLGSLGILRV